MKKLHGNINNLFYFHQRVHVLQFLELISCLSTLLVTDYLLIHTSQWYKKYEFWEDRVLTEITVLQVNDLSKDISHSQEVPRAPDNAFP